MNGPEERHLTDDERAIRELVDTWLAATKTGDVDRLMEMMVDDVVFMVPGEEPFGKAAFEAGSQEMSDLRFEGTSDIQELKLLGDWAYLRNYIEIEMVPVEGGDTVRRSGYTLTILRKGSDGKWRLARDANLVIAEES